jgi:hypothetical protein
MIFYLDLGTPNCGTHRLSGREVESNTFNYAGIKF